MIVEILKVLAADWVIFGIAAVLVLSLAYIVGVMFSSFMETVQIFVRGYPPENLFRSENGAGNDSADDEGDD